MDSNRAGSQMKVDREEMEIRRRIANSWSVLISFRIYPRLIDQNQEEN